MVQPDSLNVGPSGHGIRIYPDRGALGLALRSDRHQGGSTTEVLVCKGP